MSPGNLTEAIQMAKRERGVLSKTLIFESGVSKTQFYRIINGEFSPSLKTKSCIAKSLNIDLDTFDSLFELSVAKTIKQTSSTKHRKAPRVPLSTLLLGIVSLCVIGALMLKDSKPSKIQVPNASIANPQDGTLFIEDVTVPDGSSVVVNSKFDKTWRVKNTGSIAWKDRYLMRVTPQSDLICSSPVFVPIPETKPGQIVDITVTFHAPRVPGSCKTVWKSADKRGNLHFPDMHGLFSVVKIIEEQN